MAGLSGSAELTFDGRLAPGSSANELLDPDQKIVNEFVLLHNESRQLFNGLR